MDFQQNILTMYGADAKRWLENLPALIEAIAKKNNLCDLMALPHMSYHYVASGYQGERPVVLKLGLGDSLAREGTALEAFQGYGCVPLLAQGDGWLILERLLPGSSLKSYFPERDEEAVSVVCAVMNRLHGASVPSLPCFPHLREWFQALDKEWDMPSHLLEKGRKLRKELLGENTDVLLHGDLHHDNILTFNTGFCAIDPKGIIGNPAFEPAAFILNPLDTLLDDGHPELLIRRRIEVFAKELSIPTPTIAGFTFLRSILCWIWAIQDHTDTWYWYETSEIMDGLVS